MEDRNQVDSFEDITLDDDKNVQANESEVEEEQEVEDEETSWEGGEEPTDEDEESLDEGVDSEDELSIEVLGQTYTKDTIDQLIRDVKNLESAYGASNTEAKYYKDLLEKYKPKEDLLPEEEEAQQIIQAIEDRVKESILSQIGPFIQRQKQDDDVRQEVSRLQREYGSSFSPMKTLKYAIDHSIQDLETAFLRMERESMPAKRKENKSILDKKRQAGMVGGSVAGSSDRPKKMVYDPDKDSKKSLDEIFEEAKEFLST